VKAAGNASPAVARVLFLRKVRRFIEEETREMENRKCKTGNRKPETA
jgi:hypothetical protein